MCQIKKWMALYFSTPPNYYNKVPSFVLIWPVLESRAEIKNSFFRFLVQMRTTKSVSEIYWPLVGSGMDGDAY